MSNSSSKVRKGRNKSTNKGKGWTLEQARALVYLRRVEGIPLSKAYRRVFPMRTKNLKSASKQGNIIYQEYIRKYEDDFRETGKLHKINVDRYFSELDQRAKAMTKKDIYIEEENPESGEVNVRKKTIDVEDNKIRMEATKEIGRALGIGEQHIIQQQQNIKQNILVMGLPPEVQEIIDAEFIVKEVEDDTPAGSR